MNTQYIHMPPKGVRERLDITVSKPVAARIRKYAEKNSLTMSALIEDAVSLYMDMGYTPSNRQAPPMSEVDIMDFVRKTVREEIATCIPESPQPETPAAHNRAAEQTPLPVQPEMPISDNPHKKPAEVPISSDFLKRLSRFTLRELVAVSGVPKSTASPIRSGQRQSIKENTYAKLMTALTKLEGEET